MKKFLNGKSTLSVTPRNHADEEMIRDRAYELYVNRGMEDGHDLEDWFRAEEDVLSKNSQAAAA